MVDPCFFYNILNDSSSQLHILTSFRHTILYRAAYKGHADTVRLLLFRGANQGRQDKDGNLQLLV